MRRNVSGMYPSHGQHGRSAMVDVGMGMRRGSASARGKKKKHAEGDLWSTNSKSVSTKQRAVKRKGTLSTLFIF